MDKDIVLDESDNRNQIWVFPVFHIDNDPENLFACANIFWVKEYSVDDSELDTETKEHIRRAGKQAGEITNRGITLTNQLYQLRDMDKELDFRILKHDVYGDIKVFMVSGPSHDRRAIETGEVTIN